MSKKLTSFTVKELENAISFGMEHLTESSLAITVSHISHVDNNQITLDKVTIKQAEGRSSHASPGLGAFFVGLVLGFIICLLFFQKTQPPFSSQSLNSNPPQLQQDNSPPALPPETEHTESTQTYYSQPNH